MVTTNSLEMSFRVIDLQNSELEEDQKQAQDAKRIVEKMIRVLKPILRYIDRPFGSIRGVEVYKTSTEKSFVLCRNGSWYCFDKNGECEQADMIEPWIYYEFNYLVIGLKEAITMAEEARRVALESVAKRAELFRELEASLDNYLADDGVSE